MLLFEALRFTWKCNPKLYPKQRGVTSAIVCQFSDPVQNKIHNLFSDGVVSACKVVRSIFFSTNQLLRMEQLAVRTSANFINHLVSRTRRIEKSAAQWKHGKHEHAMVLSVKTWQHHIPRKSFAQTHLSDSWLQVNHHASWHVLACPCLRKEPSTLTSRKWNSGWQGLTHHQPVTICKEIIYSFYYTYIYIYINPGLPEPLVNR